MALLLVTYELKTANKSYDSLFSEIKNSGKWWHYMPAVWIVNTNLSADALAKKLYPHITQADSLLVIRVVRESQGWLQKDAWEWINSQLD